MSALLETQEEIDKFIALQNMFAQCAHECPVNVVTAACVYMSVHAALQVPDKGSTEFLLAFAMARAVMAAEDVQIDPAVLAVQTQGMITEMRAAEALVRSKLN